MELITLEDYLSNVKDDIPTPTESNETSKCECKKIVGVDVKYVYSAISLLAGIAISKILGGMK